MFTSDRIQVPIVQVLFLGGIFLSLSSIDVVAPSNNSDVACFGDYKWIDCLFNWKDKWIALSNRYNTMKLEKSITNIFKEAAYSNTIIGAPQMVQAPTAVETVTNISHQEIMYYFFREDS